jgi:hypothetical protein
MTTPGRVQCAVMLTPINMHLRITLFLLDESWSQDLGTDDEDIPGRHSQFEMIYR